MKTVKLKTNADDGQLYSSDSNNSNMILENTDYKFSFQATNCIDLFGVILDNELKFKQHISMICKKINNQLRKGTFLKCLVVLAQEHQLETL